MTRKESKIRVWVEKDGTIWARQTGNLSAAEIIAGMSKLTLALLTEKKHIVQANKEPGAN